MLVFALELKDVEEVEGGGVDGDEVLRRGGSWGGEGGDLERGGGEDVGGELDGFHLFVGGKVKDE